MLSLRSFNSIAIRSVLPAVALRSFAAALPGLDSKKTEIHHAYKLKPIPAAETLVFGHEFTDHMLEIDWSKKEGFHAPQIKPFGDLQMHPAASSLHYGIECFEGMKAYVDAKGNIRLFRPMENMKRLAISMARLGLPSANMSEYLECIKQLVRLEKRWIPAKRGFSLYIRPTVISTQPTLGVAESELMKMYCILSPVGPYYKTGFAPVSLVAEDKYQRAWYGGTGNCKVGGNYALTIMPQVEAHKRGFNQILWLFDKQKYCTEVGTMNFFCFWLNEKGEKELVTAPLDGGLILPGVTRSSVIDLAKSWGIKVTERQYTIHEVIKAVKEKRMLEVFGSGTAAIVSPVKNIHFEGVDYKIPLDPKDPKAGSGPMTMKFANTIMNIQYGEQAYKDWSMLI